MKKPILWVLVSIALVLVARLAVRRRGLCEHCGRARSVCCGEHTTSDTEVTRNAA